VAAVSKIEISRWTFSTFTRLIWCSPLRKRAVQRRHHRRAGGQAEAAPCAGTDWNNAPVAYFMSRVYFGIANPDQSKGRSIVASAVARPSRNFHFPRPFTLKISILFSGTLSLAHKKGSSYIPWTPRANERRPPQIPKWSTQIQGRGAVQLQSWCLFTRACCFSTNVCATQTR
jgi:hypothetical protein